MIKNAEPCEVYFPKPLMLNTKMHGHMMEQNSPPLRKANNATSPVVNRPNSIANPPNNPNTFSVKEGLSFPIKNPPICTYMHKPKSNNSLMEYPEA